MTTNVALMKLAKMIGQKSGCTRQLMSANAKDCQSGGYSCPTMRLEVLYSSPRGDEPEKTSYFIKGLTKDQLDKIESSSDNENLRNERFVYKKVIPILQNYSCSGHFGEPLPTPKLILDRPQIIVLDDLAESGFRNGNIHVGLNESEAIAAIKGMARWHAASFNLKHASMETYQKLAEQLEDNVFPLAATRLFERLWPETISFTLDTLDSIADEDKSNSLKEMAKKLRAKYGDANIPQIMNKYLRNKHNDLFTAFTHGDFWNKNIMFGAKNELKLVDFQCVFERSIAVDFWTFVVSSIHPKNTKLYFDDILQEYFATLRTSIASGGFSFGLLKEELNKFHEYSLILGIWYLPVHTITITREEIEKYQVEIMKEGGIICNIFKGKDTALYREKLYHHVMMFRDFINGHLK